MFTLPSSALKRQCAMHWKKWIILSIWIIGLASMTGLTINDLCAIIKSFNDERTNMAVQISVIRNQTIPPKLYICAPYKPVYLLNLTDSLSNIESNISTEHECQICQEMKMKGWDLWNDMDVTSTGFPKQLAGRIVTKIVQNNTAKGRWGYIKLDAIWIVFTNIQDTDDMVAKVESANIDLNKLVNFPYVPQLQNQDLEYLLEKFMEQVCDNIDWGDGEFLDNDVCVKLLLSRPVIFQQRHVCFSPEPDNVTKEIHFGIDVASDEFIQSNWDSMGTGASFDLTLEIPSYTENNIKPIFQADNGREKYRTVKMEYTVQLTVKEEREEKGCFKDNSFNDCIRRCQAEKITESCKCVPFSTRTLLDPERRSMNLSYCDIGMYKNCKPSFADCKTVCQTACKHTSYSWIAMPKYQQQQYEFEVKMVPNIAPYIEFTVKVKDNVANLLSQIGGSLGFYLGWSGLSMFGLLIFFMERYAQWRSEKLEKLKAKHKNAALHLWWWQWLSKKPKSDPQNSTCKHDDIAKDMREKIDEIKAKLEKEIEDLKEKLENSKAGV